MESLVDPTTLVTGVFVFFARVFDVTMGTMRTISIVQGRTWVAFLLGLLEVAMWLIVISAVITQIAAKPILGVFYALGFSTGNAVGILVERKIALGRITLHVISATKGAEMAQKLRDLGFGVTAFRGEGKDGPVTLLYVVCERREFRRALDAVRQIQPEAFYSTELTGPIGRVTRPTAAPATGWRGFSVRGWRPPDPTNGLFASRS
jgi:uncharacterized protein YebE (UPF0316 family)